MALQLTGAAQERFDRQPADPPAGGGDRRRPDRDRHRDRSRSPTTRCRSRSSWRATRRWWPSTARRASRRHGPTRKRDIAAGVPRPCPRDPRRARGRGARGPRAAHRASCSIVGRRHHRLSPPADRLPVLHAQPRGGREGAGGGHPLRRRPVAARRSRSTRTARLRASGVAAAHATATAYGTKSARRRCRRARPGRGRHAAQHRAGARGCRAFPPRRQVFPRCRRGRASRSSRSGLRQARARRRC